MLSHRNRSCVCKVLLFLFLQFTFASNAATVLGGVLVTNKYKLRLPAAFLSAFFISVCSLNRDSSSTLQMVLLSAGIYSSADCETHLVGQVQLPLSLSVLQ